MEEEVQNLLSQIGSQGTMNSKHNECVSFVGSKQSKWLWCGAYIRSKLKHYNKMIAWI
jgi:hypothetical protein